MRHLLVGCMFLCAITVITAGQMTEKRLTPEDTERATQFSRAGTVGVAIVVGVGK